MKGAALMKRAVFLAVVLTALSFGCATPRRFTDKSLYTHTHKVLPDSMVTHDVSMMDIAKYLYSLGGKEVICKTPYGDFYFSWFDLDMSETLTPLDNIKIDINQPPIRQIRTKISVKETHMVELYYNSDIINSLESLNFSDFKEVMVRCLESFAKANRKAILSLKKTAPQEGTGNGREDARSSSRTSGSRRKGFQAAKECERRCLGERHAPVYEDVEGIDRTPGQVLGKDGRTHILVQEMDQCL